MNENRWFKQFSLLFLERAFPRTFQVWSELERVKIAKDYGPCDGTKDLRKFAAFLSTRKWAPRHGFVPDLAQLELELKLAGMAPDFPVSGFDRVSTATEPEWYNARFRFDPAHSLLDSDWPLDEIFENPKGEHSIRPGIFLIYRTQNKPNFRRLKDNEAALIRSLSLGVPLGRVLEQPRGPDFDALTFHRWIETGLLRGIDWPEEGKRDAGAPGLGL